MPTNPEILSEIDRLSTEIDRLEKERVKIDELLTPARRERESWQFIYSRRVTDSNAVTAQTQRESELLNTPSTRIDGVEEYGAKSRIMRQHILASYDTGVTPRTVLDFMRSQDLAVSSNFVYKTLSRMREAGEIENRGGVFKPVVKENAA